SAFRLSTTAMSTSLAGSCFSSESAPGPFHHGVRRRGGTIFWAALPPVVAAGPSGHTVSPHPSSREGHHSTVGGGVRVPPIGFDPARFSCCCRGLFPGPAELSAVNPYAVQENSQPTRQRHDCLLNPTGPGDLHCPGLEP